MSNVIELRPDKTFINSSELLEKAKDSYSDNLFLVGENKEGELEIRNTKNITAKDVLWFIEIIKKKLLDGDFN